MQRTKKMIQIMTPVYYKIIMKTTQKNINKLMRQKVEAEKQVAKLQRAICRHRKKNDAKMAQDLRNGRLIDATTAVKHALRVAQNNGYNRAGVHFSTEKDTEVSQKALWKWLSSHPTISPYFGTFESQIGKGRATAKLLNAAIGPFAWKKEGKKYRFQAVPKRIDLADMMDLT